MSTTTLASNYSSIVVVPRYRMHHSSLYQKTSPDNKQQAKKAERRPKNVLEQKYFYQHGPSAKIYFLRGLAGHPGSHKGSVERGKESGIWNFKFISLNTHFLSTNQQHNKLFLMFLFCFDRDATFFRNQTKHGRVQIFCRQIFLFFLPPKQQSSSI